MTEAEWLTCIDPRTMLEFLRGKASDRKLRLFACACCRRVPCVARDSGSRRVLEAAERFSDGLISVDELEGTQNYECDEDPALDAAAIPCNAERAAYVAYCLVGDGGTNQRGTPDFWVRANAERASQANLLREIVGNPFCPATITSAIRAWNDGTIVKLARVIYEELAFDRFPVLADALEDAGCNDNVILEHLRGPGAHARGCFALDAILGTE